MAEAGVALPTTGVRRDFASREGLLKHEHQGQLQVSPYICRRLSKAALGLGEALPSHGVPFMIFRA
jgi:hypothetical protein